MTGILKSIVLGVSTAALFGGIAMTLIHTGALKETIRLGAGVMVILALLYPISRMRIDLTLDWAHQSTEAITQRVQQVQEQQEQSIAQAAAQEIQAYLVRRAKEHGIVCNVEIRAAMGEDQAVSIQGATVYGSLTDAERQWMQAMLLEECGIPQEELRYVEN